MKKKRNRNRTRHKAKTSQRRRFDQLAAAMAHYRGGRLEKAEQVCLQVAAHDTNYAQALHLAGVCAHNRGDHALAAERIQRAVEAVPQNNVFRLNLGHVLLASGDSQAAHTCFRHIIDTQPDHVDGLFALANLCHQNADYDQAITWYRRLVALNPGHAQAHHNLGVSHQAAGRWSEAIACYQQAVHLDENLPEAWFSLGNAHVEMGQETDAIVAFESALKLNAEFVDARFNLGNLHQKRGDLQEATAHYIHLLKINPLMADVHNNLGTVFEKQNRLDDSIACYQTAVKITPDYPEALYNLSLALQETGQVDLALMHLTRALELAPDYAEALSLLVYLKRRLCDWDGIEALDGRLDALTRQSLSKNKKPAEGPFLNLSRHADPAINHAVARAWSRTLSAGLTAISDQSGGTSGIPSAAKEKAGKLTVGYISNNFRNHPTSHLMRRLFALHDRSGFNIHVYSYGKDDGSVYRRQIEADSDRFVDLLGLNDRAAAETIQADGVDILVDLVGFMKDNRIGIHAMRPAPVQVRYLGFAGTTGADFFDYLVADRTVIPENHRQYYEETIIYLPDCYQINDDQPPVADRKYTRDDFGLPEDGFVFACFCSHYKLDPVMFDTWMRILAQTESSLLWLMPGSQTAENNLRSTAGKAGIDPDRLVFADKLPKEDHRARLPLVDLALDSRIVNGAATTSDALWAGVPMIALEGSHFASRMSASILSAVGMDELVTRSLASYEALAVELCQSTDKLVALRNRLAENRQSQPLFDTVRLTRNLEAAYRRMWHAAGSPNQQGHLLDSNHQRWNPS